MLLHIPSMGVLDTRFALKTYKNKNKEEVESKEATYIFCTFKNTFLENPDEWIEIPNNSKLGKKVKKYYPWITPIYNDVGKLIDVEIYDKYDGEYIIEKQKQVEIKKEEAQSRGYKHYNIRPKNLMPFLKKNP